MGGRQGKGESDGCKRFPHRLEGSEIHSTIPWHLKREVRGETGERAGMGG
jgi:hypothetical protein